MSELAETIQQAAPTVGAIELAADGKRLRWFELFLVVVVACAGSFLSSLYVLKNGPSAAPHISNARWSVGIVHEATALLLLGYVLSRRKLRFKDLGLHWSLRDVGVGLVLAAVSYVAYGLGYGVVHALHDAIFPSAARELTARDFFAHPTVLAIPFSLLNPFFEELIVRAYLMTEVTALTGSSALAVASSVAVQFSYHLYYGWQGAVALAFLFLIFSLYYARSRKALPVIVAHGFFDVYTLIRLW